MATMFDPPHPGETLREDVLPALGLSVSEAARQLGVTRAALSRVLNGRAAISTQHGIAYRGVAGPRAWRTGRAVAKPADGL